MITYRQRFLSWYMLVAVLLGTYLSMQAVSTAQAKALAGVTVTSFPGPTTGGIPQGITKGPDGNLWFAEDGPVGLPDKIVRMTTAGKTTEFDLPKIYSNPLDIVVGPNGNLWFSELNNFAIGEITTSGAITEFHIPTQVVDIVSGPDGNIWFTDGYGQIEKMTPTGTVTRYQIPNISSESNRIIVGPDGNLWFTDLGQSEIGKVTTSGVVTLYPIPKTVSTTGTITVGKDGNLWFTEGYANEIGKMTTSGVVTQYPIPPFNTTIESPVGITLGPDGNIWFTAYGGIGSYPIVGSITPSGVIKEYRTNNYDQPYYITTGPDGNLWFTEWNNEVGRVVIPNTPPPPPPGRHKAFFFVQGVTTSLDKNGDIPITTFGATNGIYQALNASFPGSDFRMFSYVAMSNKNYPAYTCPDTFSQHLSTYVGYLRAQITAYLQTHANTDVYVIGHSQGGAITYGLLEEMENTSQITTNGGRIAAVATLDSPLGGVPGGVGGVYLPFIEHKYRQDPDCQMGIPKFTSIEDLTAVFQNGNVPYGANDLILPPAKGILRSNEAYAWVEASKKVAILDIGNGYDWIYDPAQCIGYGARNIQNEFLTTQWGRNLQGYPVYAREFFAGGSSCPDTSSVSMNHSIVFTYKAVQTALIQLVNGQTPTLPNPVSRR